MDKSRYPDTWSAISRRIRERDGWKCKQCGAPNDAYIVRSVDNPLNWRIPSDEEFLEDPNCHAVKIVLTVAHWPDPEPMSCADENLMALCQSCHNRLDGPMRQAHAKATRIRKRQETLTDAGQQPLL